jgi:hypothetical protein
VDESNAYDRFENRVSIVQIWGIILSLAEVSKSSCIRLDVYLGLFLWLAGYV